MNPDWKDYEHQIFHLLRAEYLGYDVTHNLSIFGSKSSAKRQIDIGIIKKTGKKPVFGIAECKNLNRKVTINTIDSVIGKMSDIGATFGIIVTTVGYSSSAKILAQNSNIVIKTIPYEFLKDFGFTPTLELEHPFHMEEVEYPYSYCKNCNMINLYEIKVVRGFADFEYVVCPKCKEQLFETRTDGGYRVIKRFPASTLTTDEVNSVIVDHLLWTRDGWDRAYSFESKIHGFKSLPDKQCAICHKEFNGSNHYSSAIAYKEKKVCVECRMSNRTLLIDLKRI